MIKLVGCTNKYRSFVRMYGVGGQELATSGEVELDIQIGDDIVRQKFIIADIKKKKGYWGLISARIIRPNGGGKTIS